MDMYKVYFENRFITISSEPDRLQKYRLFHKFNDPNEFYKIISDFQINDKIDAINVYGPDITFIWKLFRINYTEVGAAGGLVKHSSGKYLFIEKYNRLDLPKGHIEINEDAETCALREVSEECGITGHFIVNELCPSFHTYILKGILYLKKTHWFQMSYSGKMINEPQIKEGITKIDWLMPDELSKIKDTAWLSLMDLINTSVLKTD